MTTAAICDEGKVLALTRQGRTTRFHAAWLRDNAQDAETRSATNGQRLVTILDQPTDVRIAAATCSGARLEVTFAPETKKVAFDLAWLDAHAYDNPLARPPGWIADRCELWDAALQGRVPTASWNSVSADPRALGGWLAAVDRYGFAFLTGLPLESGFLCKVADLFGYVRETNYGRWFEVRAEVNPSNLAYTNLGLQAHTDNPYRDPVPTLQLLACLENSVAGGEFDRHRRFRRRAGDTARDAAILRSSGPSPGAIRICGLDRRPPPCQAADLRAWARRRTACGSLQQPIAGACLRRAF